ncbi:MAG: hypothetical protein H7239_07685 [Flavobacterium sp.]|nr:hypothetical protein [Flavobacterium sp.]
MKKIVSIIALTLFFSFNVSAQEQVKMMSSTPVQSEDNQVKAKEYNLALAKEAGASLNLSESLRNDLTTLLFMRSDALANCKTEEEKRLAFSKYTEKFISGLSLDQQKALKSNKELNNKLTVYSSK